MATVIQPAITADIACSQIYMALDDPNADWSAALMNMLNQGPIDITSELY